MFEALGIFPNIYLLLPSCSHISVVFLISIAMKKREKSGTIGGVGKGKAVVEEKRKRSSHHTRVCMDFEPKTTELHSREDVEYLKKYKVELSPGIKVEFCPPDTKFDLSPPDGAGLKLSLTRFVCSLLTFYHIATSQLSGLRGGQSSGSRLSVF